MKLLQKASISVKLSLVIVVTLSIVFTVITYREAARIENQVLAALKCEDQKLVKAYAIYIQDLVSKEKTGSSNVQTIQALMDSINGKSEYNYVVYMAEQADGTVKAIAHSNHERIGITLDDPGSIAASKEGKSYCDYYTDSVSGKRTLDILEPIYANGELMGAFNIGVPVDEATLNHMVHSAVLESIVTSAIFCLFVILILFLALRFIIIVPLQKVSKKLNDLSDGDLEFSLRISKFNQADEIGKLADCTRNLNWKFRTIIQKLKESSDVLLHSSNELNNSITSTMEGVSQVTEAMNEVAQGSTLQAGDTSNAMAQIEELSANLETINSQMAETGIKAEETKSQSECSRGIMNELVQIINYTKASIDDIVNQSLQNEEEMKSINEIILSIQDITSQTNLLSLNASIEAARAGEAGKGFAVVAGEIGNLSSQSQAASLQIQEIVDRLVVSASSTASKAQVLNENANLQTEKLSAVDESFSRVSSSVDDVTNSVKEVQTSVHNVDVAKNTIVDVIEDLSSVSEENAATSQETASFICMIDQNMKNISTLVKDVDKIIEQLNEQISYFKIPNEAREG
ncbi:methyl-accepting chemotaxis protein [[Clostridium] polysaccharolyticum]|nr:methyl-accepting chemotaxis protein [[Clostridium] polysaccharolyticum]